MFSGRRYSTNAVPGDRIGYLSRIGSKAPQSASSSTWVVRDLVVNSRMYWSSQMGKRRIAWQALGILEQVATANDMTDLLAPARQGSLSEDDIFDS